MFLFPSYRMQKEGLDPALSEVSLKEPSGDINLARAKESVKVLEGQIKEMQPSLDLGVFFQLRVHMVRISYRLHAFTEDNSSVTTNESHIVCNDFQVPTKGIRV
jgi:hypothetical protein